MNDWTHKKIRINDIRKLKELYAISIEGDDSNLSLLIDEKIFEERIKSYFLKDISQISRKEILEAEWNMVITKGHFLKSANDPYTVTGFIKNQRDPERYYVSFLQIDGPLGSFETIFPKINKK